MSRSKVIKACKVAGCVRKAGAMRMCNTHYQKWRFSKVAEPMLWDTKTCRKCRTTKPAAEFGKHGGTSDGRRTTCRSCDAQYHLDYRNSVPNKGETQRRYSLKKNYGLSIDEYNEMFANQDGKCAICCTHATDLPGVKILCVDHNHTSGEIRSLLCRPCNTALGHLKDDVSILERAIAYLKMHK